MKHPEGSSVVVAGGGGRGGRPPLLRLQAPPPPQGEQPEQVRRRRLYKARPERNESGISVDRSTSQNLKQTSGSSLSRYGGGGCTRLGLKGMSQEFLSIGRHPKI